MKLSPIIHSKELLEHVQNENLIIIHAGSGYEAKEHYSEKHLEGALYIDLDTDLSDIKDDVANGGRHPLPTPKQFSSMLSNLGISEDNHLVIYDTNGGANSAARFWWMLRSVGHQKVQVLNGGFQEAEKAGFPISSKIVEVNYKSNYNVTEWTLPQVSINEVEKASRTNGHMIIDVRSKERYNGLEEPIDLIAGHIPGAINIPLTENLDKNGLFKSPKNLKSMYGSISENETIIHCGSGVTACHTILAMDYAGLEIPKLYVGSWSEWSRNDKKMITL